MSYSLSYVGCWPELYVCYSLNCVRHSLHEHALGSLSCTSYSQGGSACHPGGTHTGRGEWESHYFICVVRRKVHPREKVPAPV